MSNDKKQKEDLKELEDEAYFELCQIIAEALQYQDIDLLDARISAWKSKYKKLLDGSASPSFKKRIEFLLNQYYSEITQYILKQIKFKEEKKIENQRKALRKLYTIIDETNDLKTLKLKIKEWQEKYPVSAFLKMYRKKIESSISSQNLEQNAFDQEKAFYDLVRITKLNRTFDELKYELSKWEDTYSIHNKFELDDFIKNQSDVNRYTSDEYLLSIAREDKKTNNIEAGIHISATGSSLSVQASAYNSLLSIANSHNNINEIFDWVYKNHTIQFNDKYKELILATTYLEYSPKYLNSIPTPDINLLKTSLSLEEYRNIDEIKKYAVISYFNLLLPPDKAFSNNFFASQIKDIYYNTDHLDYNSNNDISITEIIPSGIEVSLVNSLSNSLIDDKSLSSDTSTESTTFEFETEVNEPVVEQSSTPEIKINYSSDKKLTVSEAEVQEPVIEQTSSFEPEAKHSSVKEITVSEIEVQKPIIEQSSSFEPKSKHSSTKEITASEIEVQEPIIEQSVVPETKIEKTSISESMDYSTVVYLSHDFFERINNYSRQAALIEIIDTSATKYSNIQSIDKSFNKSRNQKE